MLWCYLVCAVLYNGEESRARAWWCKRRISSNLLLLSDMERGRWVGGCWQSDVFFGLHYSTRTKITNSNVLIELKKKAAGDFRRNSDDHIPFPMLFVWTMRLDYWLRAIPVTWKFQDTTFLCFPFTFLLFPRAGNVDPKVNSWASVRVTLPVPETQVSGY